MIYVEMHICSSVVCTVSSSCIDHRGTRSVTLAMKYEVRKGPQQWYRYGWI